MSNSSKTLTQKSVAGIDTSKSAKKIGLATLKSNVDEKFNLNVNEQFDNIRTDFKRREMWQL